MDRFFLIMRAWGLLASKLIRSKLPKAFLRRLFRYAKNEIEVNDFDDNLTILLRLSEHMQRRIFWMGYYNEDITYVLNKLLAPNMVVLDVGANIGEITLVAAKRVGVNGRVYCFEPIDEIANKLTHHVELNKFTQIEIHRCALGNKDYIQVPIYYAQDKEDQNEGLGSLYDAKNKDRPIQYVQLITMDTWISEHAEINAIDFIKIDIEGAELACLQGAKETLQKFKPKIIIEIQNFSAEQAGYKTTDIMDLLSDLGYEFHRIGKFGKLTSIDRTSLYDFQNVLCIHCEDLKNI